MTDARSLHVLLAEDDRIVARFTKRALERRGASVVHVATGRAVLREIHARPFDLLLLDLGLPELDGWTVARSLLEAPPEHAPLVVGLTASSVEERRWRAAGIDAMLLKPLDLAALDAVVGRHRGARGGGFRPPPVPADVAREPVDFAGLRARAGGDEALVREVIGDFLSLRATWMRELRDAVEEASLPDVSHAAHRVRGALFALGAGIAGARAAELEAIAGEADGATSTSSRLRATLESLEEAVESAAASMRAHLGR